MVAIIGSFDENLCASGPQRGPPHIVVRNIERASCQLECQAIGVPRAGRNRPITSKTFRLGRSGKSATLSGDVDVGFDRLTSAVSAPKF